MARTDDCGAFWENRYRETERMWTGAPNELLVREISSVGPTTALDLGCGEGGDAVWLAARGWQVTAVDIAPTALERVRDAARATGVAERVTPMCRDLACGPPPGEFGLVVAMFLHSPVGMPRGEVLRAAAQRVAAGGTLLVVGHSGAPSWQPRTSPHTRLTTPDDVLAELGTTVRGWSVDLREMYEAPMSRPNGQVGFRVENALRLGRPV
ncbi:SAM-dependent methyltransferase [Frankia sp. CcI49]|uniref:SAM-dependent methyltransferase n=1 Tax=unclassified Frankia TaxID=2632575 RepID=UPI0006CA2FCD|nr:MULTISPECIES: class I SAM-dependent methyltransferase [unclassified Frankia]KPM53966.1 SAM-dependent methyltransferase [Frankia sp. R43]ONH61915.1 SAM-dependent methyltransferase [Frankia sp. CcI49]